LAVKIVASLEVMSKAWVVEMTMGLRVKRLEYQEIYMFNIATLAHEFYQVLVGRRNGQNDSCPVAQCLFILAIRGPRAPPTFPSQAHH
jgi:hypothetical protein